LQKGPEWEPKPSETQKIYEWYRNLDEGGLEQVGGAKIVKFLASSNLSKDILRKIWELADSERRGFVDRTQFTLIIRLVAIACSPMYAGSAPTMERYHKTVNDNIPLPQLTTNPASSLPALDLLSF
jgi:Ca2+-binding EF-hand superfamily protein